MSELDIPIPPVSAQPGSDLYKWFLGLYYRMRDGIKFSVNMNNVNQVIPNDFPTKLTFSNIITDTISGWSSNSYTIDNSGTYQFILHVKCDANKPSMTSTPFAYTENQNRLIADVTAGTAISVFDTQLMLPGMTIGFVSDALVGGTSDTIFWYTIATVPSSTTVTLTTTLKSGTNVVESGAPIYAFSISTYQFKISIYKNGSEIVNRNFDSNSLINPSLELTADIECVKNDVITAYVYQKSGGAVNVLGDPLVTSFSGKRIN